MKRLFFFLGNCVVLSIVGFFYVMEYDKDIVVLEEFGSVGNEVCFREFITGCLKGGCSLVVDVFRVLFYFFFKGRCIIRYYL